LDFVGAQAGIKWVLFENMKRLACATLLLRGQLSEASPEYAVPGRRWIDCMGRMVMRPSEREIASQPESRGIDISFITRIRLIQRGIQVYKSASFCIGHALFERFRDPGVIVFHDKFRDLRPLAGGKGFELLDNFSGAHDDQNTLPSCSPQNRYSLTLRLSTP
jgi:hypothetical protein